MEQLRIDYDNDGLDIIDKAQFARKCQSWRHHYHEHAEVGT